MNETALAHKTILVTGAAGFIGEVHAWRMPGSRHDIGDMRSYEEALGVFGTNI